MRLHCVLAEMVSSSCGLASCNGRRSSGRLHPDCDPKGAMCRHHHLRMTGRIGSRHRDSRETDTSHTSESRWAARRLQSEIFRLNRISVPTAWIQSQSGHRQPSSQRWHPSASCVSVPVSSRLVRCTLFAHRRVFR